MAVQGKYPCPAFLVGKKKNILEDFQDQQESIRKSNLFGGSNNYGDMHHVFNGTVFSEPESELTCKVSCSRKRNREHPEDMLHHKSATSALSTPFREQVSAKASTCSGLSSMVSSPLLVSSQSQDLSTSLFLQNLEVDALFRMQNENLRSVLEKVGKRHCKSLVTLLEQQVLKRVQEKEKELAEANRRNSELEEKVKQVSAENEIWFNVAQNNEAIACSLRSSLEQVLLQNQSQNQGGQIREGFGENEVMVVPADDAQSFCNERNEGGMQRKHCKVCHEHDISVLLLPCRHLCLCKNCESSIDACPICDCLKTASLQVIIS